MISRQVIYRNEIYYVVNCQATIASQYGGTRTETCYLHMSPEARYAIGLNPEEMFKLTYPEHYSWGIPEQSGPYTVESEYTQISDRYWVYHPMDIPRRRGINSINTNITKEGSRPIFPSRKVGRVVSMIGG